MSSIINNYIDIKELVTIQAKKWHQPIPKILVVSKYRSQAEILSLIIAGHRYFGENIIQEAEQKWPELKLQFPDLKLHFIGHLQSKKVKKALQLFDVIETLDSEKLATIIAKNISSTKEKEIDFYIQINIGEEKQKYGINPQNTKEFIAYCNNDLKLRIKGLMCIPPKGENPILYFAYLKKIANECNISYLSQGMSNDFAEAIKIGSNEIRIGTALFGQRNNSL